MSECLINSWCAKMLTYDLWLNVYNCTTEELLKIKCMNWARRNKTDNFITIFGNTTEELEKILTAMGRRLDNGEPEEYPEEFHKCEFKYYYRLS